MIELVMEMNLYDKLLKNAEYLDIEHRIEKNKFITDGKWDWEHGLGHCKRVANYTKDILNQLNAEERTIEMGMVAALLHDIGLVKGDKIDHAIESAKNFTKYIDEVDFTKEEIETIRQAIEDHSKGKNIQSLVGMALVLADKLDVTYHRTENSSIQDDINKEIQKVKKVDIKITEDQLIINYTTIDDFAISILNYWSKPITIPQNHLNRQFIFMINNNQVDISSFIK